MNIRKFALLVLAALCFTTLMLFLLIGRGRPGAADGASVAKPPVTFRGKLDIRTLTDLRVGGRKIVLCGVSFTKPASMEPFMREQAQRVFQGNEVECIQVGGGTPCDNRAAPIFGGAIVAQCRTKEGADLASSLAESGYLCDLPAQSGGAYHAC